LSGPIILLNQDYFIYSSRGSVFFHSRVKEWRIFLYAATTASKTLKSTST